MAVPVASESFDVTDLLTPSLLHWSTDAVPPSQRFAFFENVLATAVTALRIASDGPASIKAEIEMAVAGHLRIYRMKGTPHRTLRGPREIARGKERTFHLFANLVSSWKLTHRTPLLLAPGDVVLTDSAIDHAFDYPGNYHLAHMTLSESWLRQWVPDPGVLVGRRIAAESPWGRALLATVTALTPRFAVDSKAPTGLVSDVLGGLLAIIAHQLSGHSSRAPTQRATGDLRQRIKGLIQERCTEPLLTASDIAAALGISIRTLHRHLTSSNETFGRFLLDARVDMARRLLESPIARRLSIAEIGRRAGFRDASHFAKVVRSRSGLLPSQLRAAAGLLP